MSTPETTAAPGKAVVMADLKPTPVGNMPNVAIGFATLQGFELSQRVGKMFAMSTVVPDTFKGNIGNCAIALEMANRMGASPLMVMQNLDVIYGRPSWRAKFLIACFNQCGRYDSISYEWGGKPDTDKWTCRAISKDLRTGNAIRGPEISIALAKLEGWYDKKGSKWKTIPELMLMYRAASWMIATTAPEISMGLQTDDELRDTFDAQRGGDGRYAVDLESLRRQESAGKDKAEIVTPDIKDVIVALQKCDTLAALEACYRPVLETFVSAGENVPIEVQAAYDDRKAAIEQKL